MFSFTKENVEEIVESSEHYSKEIRDRVKAIIFEQMRKYKYLFSK